MQLLQKQKEAEGGGKPADDGDKPATDNNHSDKNGIW